MKFLTSFIAILILCGCACGDWTHPTKGRSQFSIDRTACSKHAWNETEDDGINGVSRKIALMENCMRDKGWKESD